MPIPAHGRELRSSAVWLLSARSHGTSRLHSMTQMRMRGARVGLTQRQSSEIKCCASREIVLDRFHNSIALWRITKSGSFLRKSRLWAVVPGNGNRGIARATVWSLTGREGPQLTIVRQEVEKFPPQS